MPINNTEKLGKLRDGMQSVRTRRKTGLPPPRHRERANSPAARRRGKPAWSTRPARWPTCAHSQTVKAPDEIRHDGCRLDGFTPRHNAEDPDIHGEVEYRDRDDRPDDGAGDNLLRLPDLAREEADVIVPPVIVHRDQGGAAKAKKKAREGAKAPGGEIEQSPGIHIQDTGDRDPADCGEHHDPHAHRQPLDGTNVPIQHEGNQQAHCHRYAFFLPPAHVG